MANIIRGIRTVSVIAFFLASRIAFANETDMCGEFVQDAVQKTLFHEIESADFIGIYAVEKVAESGDMTSDGNQPLYVYELTNSAHLFGATPARLKVEGLKPYGEIPADYLATIELHKQFELDISAGIGTTFAVKRVSDGACFFAPRMKVGFSYLILGGTNSPVSFEFIPHARIDRWIQIVRDALRELGPKRNNASSK